MELFFIKRTDDHGYDEFDSFVVAAENAEAARATHPYGQDYKWNGKEWFGNWRDTTWADPATLLVEHIGTAKEGVSGVICASFNAG